MTKILPIGKTSLSPLKGFTLVELLVVLTIVSVLVSSISYVVSNRNESLKTITSNIVHNLRMIQQQAIRSDQPYQVEIDLGNNRIDFFDESIELPGEISMTVRTSEDQLIDDAIAGMTFYPDASSSGGVIILESEKEVFEISVIWISGKIETRHQNKSS